MIVVRDLKLLSDDTVRCKFGEELVDGEVVNASTVVCRAPAGTREGSVVVRLQVGKDGVYAVGAGVFEYMITPTVREFLPSMGPEAGGRLVSVYGTGFKPGDALCRFGPQAVPVSYTHLTLPTIYSV